jgi:predicted GIY-YIG superfamily endonuclease
MDQKFAALVETLAPKLDRLLAMSPLTNGALPRAMPDCGVYLFTENDKHLYVGRSNDLRGRYGLHCRPGATDRQAAFAFQLAREETGRVIRSYKQDENSRKALMELPEFRDAFTEAKARIRRMEYRFVEETDQNCQALLEIYCSIVLGTPYNDFKTH